MDLFETLINLLNSQNFSLAWVIMSSLIGYIIFHQNQMCKELDEQKKEILTFLKESKVRYDGIESELQNLRQYLKEEVSPSLDNTLSKLRDMESIHRSLEEYKNDQRCSFHTLHDAFNQFRSEFRDILKLVLNGKKLYQ